MAQLERQYVTIPKDLAAIKQKFLFNLTKRQCVCFGIGISLGFPVFFLTKGLLGLTAAVFLMGLVAAPAIMCGIYEKNGLHLEQVAKNMFLFYKNPQVRTYQSENLYLQIEKEIEYYNLKRKLQTIERSSHGKQQNKPKHKK